MSTSRSFSLPCHHSFSPPLPPSPPFLPDHLRVFIPHSLHLSLFALHHDTHLLHFFTSPLLHFSFSLPLSLSLCRLSPSNLLFSPDRFSSTCFYFIFLFLQHFSGLRLLARLYSFPLRQVSRIFPIPSIFFNDPFLPLHAIFLSVFISLPSYSSSLSRYLLHSFTSILFTVRGHYLFPSPGFCLLIVPRILDG